MWKLKGINPFSVNMHPVVVLERLTEEEINYYTKRTPPSRRSKRMRKEKNLKDEQHVDFSFFEEYRRSRNSYLKRKEKQKLKTKHPSKSKKKKIEAAVTADSSPFAPNSVVLNINVLNKNPEALLQKTPDKKKFKRIIESDSDCSVENYGIVYANEGPTPFYSEVNMSRDLDPLPQGSLLPNSMLFSPQNSISVTPNISPSCSDVIVNENDILSALDRESPDKFYVEVLKGNLPKSNSSVNFDTEKFRGYMSENEFLLEKNQDKLSEKSTTKTSSDLMQKTCDVVSKIMQEMDNSFISRTSSHKKSSETIASKVPPVKVPISKPMPSKSIPSKPIPSKSAANKAPPPRRISDAEMEKIISSILETVLNRVCLSSKSVLCSTDNKKIKRNRSCVKCHKIISQNFNGLPICNSCSREPSPANCLNIAPTLIQKQAMKKKAQEIMKKVRSPMKKSKIRPGIKSQILKQLKGSEKRRLLFYHTQEKGHKKPKDNLTVTPLVIKFPPQNKVKLPPQNKVVELPTLVGIEKGQQSKKKTKDINLDKKSSCPLTELSVSLLKSKVSEKIDKGMSRKQDVIANVESAQAGSALSKVKETTTDTREETILKSNQNLNVTKILVPISGSDFPNEGPKDPDLLYEYRIDSMKLQLHYKKTENKEDYNLKQVIYKNNDVYRSLPISNIIPGDNEQQKELMKDTIVHIAVQPPTQVTNITENNTTQDVSIVANISKAGDKSNLTSSNDKASKVPGDDSSDNNNQLLSLPKKSDPQLAAIQEMDAIAILSILDLDNDTDFIVKRIEGLFMNELEDMRKLKELYLKTTGEDVKKAAEAQLQSKHSRVTSLTFAKMLLRQFGSVPEILNALNEQSGTSMPDIYSNPKSEKIMSDCMLNKPTPPEFLQLSVPFLNDSEETQIEEEPSLPIQVTPMEKESTQTISVPNSYLDPKSEARKERSSCMLSSLLVPQQATGFSQGYSPNSLQQISPQPLVNVSSAASALAVVPSNALVPVSQNPPVYVSRPSILHDLISQNGPIQYQITSQANIQAPSVPTNSNGHNRLISSLNKNVQQRNLLPYPPQQGANMNNFNLPLPTTGVQANYVTNNTNASPLHYPSNNTLPTLGNPNSLVGQKGPPNKTVPFIPNSQVIQSLENMNRSLIPYTGTTSSINTPSINNTMPPNPLRVQQVVISNIRPAIMQNQNRMPPPPPPPYNYSTPQLATSNAQQVALQQMSNMYMYTSQPGSLYTNPVMPQNMIISNQNAGAPIIPQQQNSNVQPGVPLELSSCVLCKKRATMRCKQCARVVYCSSDCARIYWQQKHKAECIPQR